MSDIIFTKSTSKETIEMSPIVLRETKTTRLIFEPLWVDVSVSENPLRGGFRYQRKGLNDTWENFDSKSLGSLHKDEEYKLNLQPKEICELLSKLEAIQKHFKENGHISEHSHFIINQDNVEGIFLQIGQAKNRTLVVEQLKKLEHNNFENLGNVIGRVRLENAIKDITNNIQNENEDYWQDFFEKNTWILQQVFSYPVIYLNGETYLGGKNSKGRQGSGGSATDFLFQDGSSGSFAVVEIKTPDCNLVGTCYRGIEDSGDKNEVYRIHGDLTGGIVQLENQIHVAIEYFKTQIGTDFREVNHINPTGVLIAGNKSKLKERQKHSLNLFRKSIGKNQIFTFDEVLAKLKLLKNVYEK